MAAGSSRPLRSEHMYWFAVTLACLLLVCVVALLVFQTNVFLFLLW